MDAYEERDVTLGWVILGRWVGDAKLKERFVGVNRI